MNGVVIVFFQFNPRILDMADLYFETKLPRLLGNQFSELANCEGLRKLVENPKFSPLRGVQNGKLDAPESVSDVQKSPILPTGSVNRERNTRDGLDAKAIQRRAEDFIIVETSGQALIHPSLICFDPVHHPL